MNNIDGLKKIYLIKSADYQYAEIDLTDNTLLLGESGVGKTTLMRAILFFYTMDYSDTILNLNPDTKIPFNQWYFKEPNSHIVYEYTKDESRFLFVVSKSGNLHYTFVDMTNTSLNVKDIFLQKNRPLNIEELNEVIQTNSLPNYTTSKRDKYINAFHKKDSDGRKIKQESQTNFALFEDISSRKEFAKTLSNIFSSSKVNSDSLKKTIVSLIEDSNAHINLKTIKEQLNEYVLQKKEIEAFEKNFSTIRELRTTLLKYGESKKEFKKLSNEILTLKSQSSMKIQESEFKLSELKRLAQESEMNFKVSSQIVNEKISTKRTVLTLQKNEIDILLKKEHEYKQKNITALVAEHNNEESYLLAKSTLSTKYKVLTANFNDVNSEFMKILKKLEQERDNTIFNLNNAKNLEQNAINTQKITLIQDKEQKILNATSEQNESKKTLEKELTALKEVFNEIKIAQGKLEHFSFNSENLKIYSDEVKFYDEELLKISPKKIQTQHSIEKVEKELFEISQTLKVSKEQLISTINSQKEALFDSKRSLEKKIDFNSQNLYGYLKKHKVENREKILTYLKDDVLFSDVAFEAKEIESKSSIFGLEVKFEEDFTFEYKYSEVVEQLDIIKSKIKSLNKKAILDSEKLENLASTESKVKNIERSNLYATQKELNENERAYTKNRDSSEASLQNAQLRAKKEKKQKTQELNQNFIEQKSKIDSQSKKLQKTLQEIEFITNSINSKTAEDISRLEQKLTILEQNLVAEIKKAKESYTTNAQTTKNELALVLKQQGVNQQQLDKITNEITEFSKKIALIKSNNRFVTVYLSEYRDKIETIPSLKKVLADNEFIFKNLEKELEEIQKESALSREKISNEVKKFKDIKLTLENFLANYRAKIADKEIEEVIKESQSIELKSQSAERFDEKNFIQNIVSNLTDSFNEVVKNSKDIENQTQRALKGLSSDNIFKIEIIDDYLESSNNLSKYINIADNLVEYVDKDKIKILKEVSSEMFKSSLVHIRKELSIFEEAIFDIDAEVMNLKNRVKKAVDSFNVIDNISLRFLNANSEVLNALKSTSEFYTQNSEKFLSGLFVEDNQKTKDELGEMIVDLVALLSTTKEYLTLESGFTLEFKVVEKGNDLKWRQTLNDIGSNGTSTLVKSIINISILQMVSKNIVKKHDIVMHCILDEIGTISTDYFKELKEFVNSSGFLFVNGMPIEDDILISMYPTVYVGENCGSYSKMLLASKTVL